MLRFPTRSLSRAVALTSVLRTSTRFESGGSHSTPLAESNWKIYRSQFPSILPKLEGQNSFYEYSISRMKATDPKRVAVIQGEDERPYTYEEVVHLTERIAQVLYHVGGVRKGDVVSICSLNHALYGPMVYGILRLGAIVSTINAVAAPETLAYHFKTNRCKVVLAQKFFANGVETGANIAERETGGKIKVLYPADFLAEAEERSLSIPAEYHPTKDAKPDDTVFIPFSSGTTGMPKGVQLTNVSLVSNLEQSLAVSDTQDGEVTISVLPMFHIFSFVCNLATFLTCGGTQVVMTKYNVEEYIRLCAKYKATYNAVAPPIVISILNHPELLKKYDLSSLLAMRCASAPLGPEVEAMCKKMLPWVSVAQGYGMTEMSPVCSNAPSPRLASCPLPPSGSSGMLLPDTELRVVKVDDSQQSGSDRSAGIDCAPGEEGEIWVRGPQMFKGYLNKEDTEKTMQDGWYRTGDIGHFDEKTGYLTITDRLKELIKYKGFQVSPASVEALLLQHPWVADCVVVGVPDPRDVSFEIPRALVVLKKDLPMKAAVEASDNIYRFVMARNPPHKRLHGGVRIVDAVPRNASNKIMRRQIRSDEVELMKADSDPEHRRVKPTPSVAATA